MSADRQPIPTPAFVLGLGGLIPFFTTATLVWWALPIEQWLPQWILREMSASQLASYALGAYGAVILSFLGGVRWGNLLFDRANLRYWTPLTLSVIPSLIAWPALLLPQPVMLSLLAAGFVFQYVIDVAASKRGELPDWFVRLRLILTSGAVFSLLIGLAGHFVR